MSLLYDLFLLRWTIGPVMSGKRRPAHILLSLSAVIASGIIFGIWLQSNGCELFFVVRQVAAPHSSVTQPVWIAGLFAAIWAGLALFSAMKRSVTGSRAIDIQSEGYCLAIPFAVLPVAAGVIALVLKVIVFNQVFAAYYYLALTNILVAATCVHLYVMFRELLDCESESKSSNMGSVRMLAELVQGAIANRKYESPKTLVFLIPVILLSCGYFGYENSLAAYPQFLEEQSPYLRSLIAAAIPLIFWICAGVTISSYRVKQIGDHSGMKVAVLGIGWALARFSIAVSTVTFIGTNLDIFRPTGPDTTAFLLIPVLLLSTADLFITMVSLLVLSPRYSPLVVKGADMRGKIASSYDQFSDWLAVISKKIFLAPPSLWRLLLGYVPKMFSLGDSLPKEMVSQSRPARAIAVRIVGNMLLVLYVITYVVAICIVERPMFPSFVTTHRLTLDIPFALWAAGVYIIVMVLLITLVSRVSGSRMNMPTASAIVGFALTPSLLAVVAVLVFRRPLAMEMVAAPVLLWGAAYIVLNLGVDLLPRYRPISALSIPIIGLAIAHLIASQAIWVSCMAWLRWSNIPIINVSDTIVSQAPATIRDDLRTSIEMLTNIERVEIPAANLIDQAVYIRKSERRFRDYSAPRSDMLHLRIRGESAKRTDWPRLLYPEMRSVTRSAQTPDAAARLIFKWVNSTVPYPKLVTYPLGDKFDQDPVATWRSRRGTQLDAAILMVAALRAAGVCARMAPELPDRFATGTYWLAEYYDGVEWKPCYPRFGASSQGPEIEPSDLAAAEALLRNPDSALYVLVDGVWHPYDGNDPYENPAYNLDLLPGTYLVSYVVDDVCHIKRFTLHAARNH